MATMQPTRSATAPAQRRMPACSRARTARVVCAAQQTGTLTGPSRGNPMLMGAIEAIFKFPPLFSLATQNARNMMKRRVSDLGLQWEAEVVDMGGQAEYERRLQAATNPAVVYPSYYTQPFHAYQQGNLCWAAALEFNVAALAVHAPIMDPLGKTLDREGDARMRASYAARMAECMADLGAAAPPSVKAVLDLGSATGVSSRALGAAFPGASVTAVDASPHMVAVGRFEQERREAATGVREPLAFVHALAEDTRLPAASFDVVSMCLVFHELPQSAARAIMKEGYRLVKPGGVMSIMEMNPASPAFQRVLANPVAFTAFKSTEPWLQEYVALDMPGALREAGFAAVAQRECSPRHKTVVALKR